MYLNSRTGFANINALERWCNEVNGQFAVEPDTRIFNSTVFAFCF